MAAAVISVAPHDFSKRFWGTGAFNLDLIGWADMVSRQEDGGFLARSRRRIPTWPPATVTQVLYIDKSNKLSSKRPIGESSIYMFKAEPDAPTPTMGGPLLFNGGTRFMGDQNTMNIYPQMRMQRRKRRTMTQILKALAVRMASTIHGVYMMRTTALVPQQLRDPALEMIPMTKNMVTSVAGYLDLVTPQSSAPPPVFGALPKVDRQDAPHSY
ncbi:hypothetical protein QQZ08_007238 [Neonectria magnoliae]|uniref:Uncharacterized protein n=1 Tax=Neonectria magnoliae TaxID=2732573 RepID=A0ABR1HZ08_9HYPO